MINRRTLAVIKRELKVRLLSKTFIFMTLLIPLFMFGIIGIQVLLQVASGDEHPHLLIISESETIDKVLKDEFLNSREVREGSLSVQFDIAGKDIQEKLIMHKPDLLNEKLTGIVYVPDSSLDNKEIRYYSTNPNNVSLFNRIKPAINNALVDLYFSRKSLSLKDIEFARNDVDITGFRVTKAEKIQEEGYGNLIALFLFSFLLYIALIFAGQMTMNAVVEEKNSRIVEVLLSSASSRELMTGKIFGTAIIELAQMAIWLSPVIILISTAWFAIPTEFIMTLNLSYILYFLLNYLIALITFIGLYAAVGAIFDNPQDAQSGVLPLILLIMIPFFIALSLQSNPQSPVAKVASFFPFASLIVMPARMSLLEVPFMQVLISFVINVTVMLLIFPLVGKIYRVGILITGKKPKWSEVIRWLKYKY